MYISFGMENKLVIEINNASESSINIYKLFLPDQFT